MQYSAQFIKDILARHGKTLQKSLGQNFLYDREILDHIVSSAVGDKNQNIVEIGAGVGILTNILCQNASKVVTIEIDDSLPEILSETVPHPNFFLHLEDVLRTDLAALATRHFAGEKFTVVGNLPYYITAKILDKLTLSLPLLERIVIMVQREAALRLQSAPGSKEYRAATVQVQALYDVEYICTVPPHCFVPAPHVDSAVIRLTPKKDPMVQEEDIAGFLCFTEQAFSARRKQLKGLAPLLGTTAEQMAQALSLLGFAPTARAEALLPEQMAKLYYIIKKPR